MLHIDDDSPDANYANTRAGADYINASFINSYFATGAFIVTQAPLSSTKADLWKMVYEQNATAIINLAQPHEQEIYWPESGSQSYGQFTIELLSSETRNAFTLYKLWLSKVCLTYWWMGKVEIGLLCRNTLISTLLSFTTMLGQKMVLRLILLAFLK
jgi:hypothetical protein